MRPSPEGNSHTATGSSSQASRNSPMGPTFRANSFPEVTNLICRLPLPTLFYRLEAAHLGDLLRIWVRTGKRFTKLPSHFQGPCGARETPQERRCFTRRCSLSPAEPFPGCAAAKPEKRTLAPTPHSVCEFICVAALNCAGRLPAPRSHLLVLVQEY
jgi:hypothetical protein